MGILDMRQLVSAHVGEGFNLEETFLGHGIIKLSAGHGMSEGNLDSFGIEFLSKINGLLNSFARFARQPDDEVAVNANADFATILHEGTRHFYRGALLDVLKNLRVAGFKSHDEQSCSRVGHGFQRVVIAVHARCGGPLKFQRLELGAEIENAILANIKGVVVEENLFHLREIFDGLFYFAGHVFRRTRAPGMAGNRLRPHAESAQRWAAAGGVKRHVRIQEERNVVALYFQIALVNICREWQRVELGGVQLLARRIVDDFAVFAIADAHDFAYRLAVSIFHNGMVEFA